MRTELGNVNGYMSTRTQTVTPPNASAFSFFPGIETMKGHENITIFAACTPAGSALSACTGTGATGTTEDAALDECNPCTLYNSSGAVIGTGSIDFPWWQSSGHTAHQHVALVMHGTGGLTNVHGVTVHPGTTDPRCAPGLAEEHYVGCYCRHDPSGQVHQRQLVRTAMGRAGSVGVRPAGRAGLRPDAHR